MRTGHFGYFLAHKSNEAIDPQVGEPIRWNNQTSKQEEWLQLRDNTLNVPVHLATRRGSCTMLYKHGYWSGGGCRNENADIPSMWKDKKMLTVSSSEVVPPERTESCLAANVPHDKVNIPIDYWLHVETDCGYSGVHLAEFELVQQGCFTGGVETNHEKANLPGVGEVSIPYRREDEAHSNWWDWWWHFFSRRLVVLERGTWKTEYHEARSANLREVQSVRALFAFRM